MRAKIQVPTDLALSERDLARDVETAGNRRNEAEFRMIHHAVWALLR